MSIESKYTLITFQTRFIYRRAVKFGHVSFTKNSSSSILFIFSEISFDWISKIELTND